MPSSLADALPQPARERDAVSMVTPPPARRDRRRSRPAAGARPGACSCRSARPPCGWPERALDHRLGRADEGDHGAVRVGARVDVEQRHAAAFFTATSGIYRYNQSANIAGVLWSFLADCLSCWFLHGCFLCCRFRCCLNHCFFYCRFFLSPFGSSLSSYLRQIILKCIARNYSVNRSIEC